MVEEVVVTRTSPPKDVDARTSDTTPKFSVEDFQTLDEYFKAKHKKEEEERKKLQPSKFKRMLKIAGLTTAAGLLGSYGHGAYVAGQRSILKQPTAKYQPSPREQIPAFESKPLESNEYDFGLFKTEREHNEAQRMLAEAGYDLSQVSFLGALENLIKNSMSTAERKEVVTTVSPITDYVLANPDYKELEIQLRRLHAGSKSGSSAEAVAETADTVSAIIEFARKHYPDAAKLGAEELRKQKVGPGFFQKLLTLVLSVTLMPQVFDVTGVSYPHLVAIAAAITRLVIKYYYLPAKPGGLRELSKLIVREGVFGVPMTAKDVYDILKKQLGFLGAVARAEQE